MREHANETRIVIRIVCDRCFQQKDFTYGGGGSCSACGRDVCSACNVHDDRDSCDDYPPVYCKECWQIGKPFRVRQDVAERECCAAVEQAQEEWKAACSREGVK